jgi:Nucleotidyltransferase domain
VEAADSQQEYLAELANRLEESLGERLMSVLSIGSYALGAFDPRTSDLDVIVVVDRPLTVSDWDAVVDSCSHESLPVPARKLELVAYTRPQVAAPRRNQGWELNFHTGPGVRHAGHDPMAESWHWFVLDLAQARQHAITLYGEPAREVIGEVGDNLVQDALAACLTWYELHEPGPQLMLAAARAWHWNAEKRWTSKSEAWAWAASYVDDKLGRTAER